MITLEGNPIELMKEYEQPNEPKTNKQACHRKHVELSKMISGFLSMTKLILNEIKVIKTYIGEDKLCPIRKTLRKIKAREEFIKDTQREIQELKNEL